jgi:hypothetical protein
MKEILTFEDGVILCKYIYQLAIDKTLNGVIEEEEIFYRAHEILKKISNKTNYNRLNDILRILKLENISATV